MQIMCYHDLFFIKKYGCFKKFTSQGVEKNNNDAKRALFQKSNKWDSVKDILFLEGRQWELRKRERKKFTYTKKNSDDWNVEIINQRKKGKELYTTRTHLEEDETSLNSTAPSLVDFQFDYRSFTVRQLREEIKSKGLGRKD